MRKLTAFVWVLLAVCRSATAHEAFDQQKMDSFLNLLEEHDKAMLSVAIHAEGRPVYEAAIGYASVESNKENTVDTRFRIGSITKTFTAVMIFQLIEEGVLSLDTRLSDFFPQIQNAGKITLAQMLNHSSGIHNFTADAEYLTYHTEGISKADMLALIASYRPDFEPGERTAYSNSNYVLLGYIIEDATGMPYSDQIEARILKRLGLKDTYVGSKIDAHPNEAFSYSHKTGHWQRQPETDMSIPHAAGAVVSTPNDLCRLIRGLFQGKLVSNDSLSEMKNIQRGMGKGLLLFPFGDKRAFGHNGEIDGFVSNLAYFPEEDVAVAVLANGMNSNFNDILIGLLSICFGVDYALPDFSAKPVTLSPDELQSLAGEFISQDLPLGITLSINKGQLIGRATGQSPFPLTPHSETEFRFEPAGISIVFETDNFDNFTLNQSGAKYRFTRAPTPPPVDLPVEYLERLSGTFSSDDHPLKIELRVENGRLYAQATGQSPFPLTAFSQREFRFPPAGIVIKFDGSDERLDANAFSLHQGGGVFSYARESKAD